MSEEFEGLTEFQKDLLTMAQKTLPKESYKIMRTIGNKAAVAVRKEARSKVKKETGMYHKRFKRGKVFRGNDGEYVVRVFNSSPHAHLIEHGHQLIRGSFNVGFATGKKVMYNGAKNFETSGQVDKLLSDWLDSELDKGNL